MVSCELSTAAQNGHEGVVKRLLEQLDVNPDPTDQDGQIPVSGAPKEGHEEVMNINPNTADKDGQRQLLWAAHNGHEES